MKMYDLRDRLDADPAANPNIRYLATSPVVKQPGTLPYRTVLYQKGEEFVVHYESFNEYEIDPVSGHLECSKPSFYQGNYFRADQLVEAMNCFAQRVVDQAKCVRSIYREEEVGA
ncbi:MAG: hypothetical protein DWQ19_13005 [Crenarchaeota archaeon]|nr:MAG: hypothetical protein DWQ19_13005 [Thermoproteota archaeon]